MPYEIEVRSRVDVPVWENLRRVLAERGKLIGSFRYRTLLFRSPSYLRIRITEGSDHAVLTIKEGEGVVRQESNEEIPLSSLKEFLESKAAEGFSECADITSISFAYSFMGARVDMNHVDHLGHMIEVEMLSDDREEVVHHKTRVFEIMSRLGLAPLEDEGYQEMLDEMYEQATVPVSSITL